MKYTVDISSTARRDLRRIDRQYRRRVQDAIDNLAKDPFPIGSRKLQGYEISWRVRIGPFRIVYDVYNDLVLVVVLRAVRRSEDTYRI
jgi:mRNA interferase RelE/StbE